MDSNLTPYMTELAVTWALCAAGIVFIAPVIYYRVKDRECNHACFRWPRLLLMLTFLRCRHRGACDLCGVWCR